MDNAAACVTILNNSSALLDVLTGGVFEFQDQGRKGLNRIAVLQAFIQASGLLKPVCVLY